MRYLFRRYLRSAQPVPLQFKRNFLHLYLDIFWWGVLNGSILVFLGVYAARLGATTLQQALISSSPALVNLIFTFPASMLAKRYSSKQATFWSALLSRMFYLLLVPLPVLLPAQPQIWVIIALTLVMNIPGTMAAVVGNAFFAETVPPEWRGQVVGTRNALLAAASMATSLVVGQVLVQMPFAQGYMVVFGIGVFGAAMSLLHVFLIRPTAQPETCESSVPVEVCEELDAADRSLIRSPRNTIFRFDVIRGGFGRTLLMVLAFHIGVYLTVPLFPQYQVNVLHFTDRTISVGSAVFWVVHVFGSTQSFRLANRMGFKRLTALGCITVSFAILLFAFSYQPWIYYLTQTVSGIGWSMVSGGLLNYILEKVPSNDRPPYLAWYNISLNGALLLGGMLAPLFAGGIGLFASMLVAFGIRLLAALVIWKWG